MKRYRNLKPDETLQMGDQRMDGNGGWKPAEAVWIGQPVPEDLTVCFRRPVDAVPREEYERLQDVLAEVRYLHGHAMHDRDTMREQLAALQSQPRLQPVTPEAMAELESRHAVGVLIASEYCARVLNYSQQYGHWWRDEWGAGIRVDRPWQGWFIELSKLKEVQQ